MMNQIILVTQDYELTIVYQNQSFIATVSRKQNQAHYWNISFTTQNMNNILIEYLKTTKKLFQFILKNPKQRIQFLPFWKDHVDNEDKNCGTLVINAIDCDQIVKIKIKIPKKQYSQRQLFEKRYSKIEFEKIQLEKKVKILQIKLKQQENYYQQKIKTIQIKNLKLMQQLQSQNLSKNQLTKDNNKNKVIEIQKINVPQCLSKKYHKLSLHLQSKSLQLSDIVELVKSKNWDIALQAVTLRAQNNLFGDEGLQILSKQKWKNLKEIFISDCQIKNLSALKDFDLKDIQILNVHCNYLTLNSAQFLLSFCWQKLKVLALSFQKESLSCWKLIFLSKLKQMPLLQLLQIYIFEDFDDQLKTLKQQLQAENKSRKIKVRKLSWEKQKEEKNNEKEKIKNKKKKNS